MADDIERLISAMAKYIIDQGSEFPDHLIDLVLENVEARKDERCRDCDLSIMEHPIKFFKKEIDHNFERAVRVTKCN